MFATPYARTLAAEKGVDLRVGITLVALWSGICCDDDDSNDNDDDNRFDLRLGITLVALWSGTWACMHHKVVGHYFQSCQ